MTLISLPTTLFFLSLLFVVSSSQSVDCGAGRCFNGGTCLSHEVNGATEYRCDCSATYHSGTAAFAGRYCQYQETTSCPTNDGSTVKLFCVNNGSCRQDDPYAGCDCPAPYTGFMCESKISEAQNDHGDYDTINSNSNNGYNNGPSLPEPSDPSLTNDPAPAPVAAPSSRGGGVVGSIVYQDSSSSNKDDDQTTPSNSGTQGGDIGNQVYYNDKSVDDDDNKNNDLHDEMTIAPVSDINICTIDGSTLDAKPLSFCVNGGFCLRNVTTLQGYVEEWRLPCVCLYLGVRHVSPCIHTCISHIIVLTILLHSHAGCACSAEWTGPHCEISVAVIQAAQADEDRSMVAHAFGVVVIVLAVLAIAVVAVFATVMACRNNKRRRRQSSKSSNNSNNRLRWGPAYSDNDDINLAPRQSFYDAEFPATTTMSSSRDPMAHLGAAHPANNNKSRNNNAADDDDQGPPEPQIYIGPPRDEDGHVLHSVEIL